MKGCVQLIEMKEIVNEILFQKTRIELFHLLFFLFQCARRKNIANVKREQRERKFVFIDGGHAA